MQKIKLLRNKNIRFIRHSEGEVLSVGKDVSEAQAKVLIRTKNATNYIEPKPAKQTKKQD